MDEVETMAYAGQVPWHGLGHKISNDLGVDEMMRAAGLDWTVQKGVYTGVNPVTGLVEASKTVPLYRMSDGKRLAEVSQDWEPVQNREAFEFFREFVEKADLTFETAGSLRGGQFVWVLAKVKETFELFKKDRIENYFLFVNPHEYGNSIRVGMNPIRVVCMNTLRLGLSKSNASEMVSVTHRNKFSEEKVKGMLKIGSARFDMYKEQAEFLGSKKATLEKIKEFAMEIFPVTGEATKKTISKNAQLVLESLETQPGAEFGQGTWWQAFNAVTFVTDHKMGRTQDTRLYNSWIGTEANRKIKAMTKALEFATAA